MTKGTIQRPGFKPTAPRGSRPAQEPERAPGQSSSVKGSALKKADDKKLKAKPEVGRSRRPQRPQRPHGGVAGARGAHGPGADAHDDDVAPTGLGAVEAGSAGDELHRRRSAEVEQLHEEEEVERHEEAHETGAEGPDAIKRSNTGADTGSGDGFEGRDDPREAYERYMRGHVRADKERFDELRRKGTRDDFKPERGPAEVEALGTNRATAHMVRLYETWTLAGVGREASVQKAATFLAGFKSVANIRKVLAELESKPIRDVYPLEVLLKILHERPEFLPGVREGKIIGNAAELLDGKQVLAGRPVTVQVPPDVRLKSFALLGGGRPGYEFAPAIDDGKFTLLVDTPGEWAFAVLAAPLQQLGRIQRETQEAILELFRVTVHAMGKKGEPIPPSTWRALQGEGLEDDEGDEGDEVDDGDDGDNGNRGDGAPPAARGRDMADALALTPSAVMRLGVAPNLAVQIRTQLETIHRDEVTASIAATATMYSWDARFYKPGAPMLEPILHLVVNRAAAFDAAWSRAREALAQKQREYEPGRAQVTQEDFTAALRRARVR